MCDGCFLCRELGPYLAAAASGSRLQRCLGSLSVAPGAHESVPPRQRPHRPAGPARGAALHRGTSADPSTFTHCLTVLNCPDANKRVCVCFPGVWIRHVVFQRRSSLQSAYNGYNPRQVRPSALFRQRMCFCSRVTCVCVL